jgi:hypothetical protein
MTSALSCYSYPPHIFKAKQPLLPTSSPPKYLQALQAAAHHEEQGANLNLLPLADGVCRVVCGWQHLRGCRCRQHTVLELGRQAHLDRPSREWMLKDAGFGSMTCY